MARTESEQLDLSRLSRAVYPPYETLNWPGRHLEWAGSEWDIMVSSEDALVSYTGALLRQAAHDENQVLVGGIGGVKTHPKARKRGFAAAGMAKAIELFVEREAAFALLVCDDKLVDYYTRLGWHLFTGRVVTLQSGQSVEFTFNRVMVRDVSAPAPISGLIDLQGPPW